MRVQERRRFLRRSGLGATAAWAAPALLSAGLDEPALPVIDAHTHFYDPTRREGVPWPNRNDKLLYRPVLPRHFKELTELLGVTGTVVVEASSWVEDNQWILDLAKDAPFLVGLVGHLEPGEPEFRKHLDRFARAPRFRGIRVNGAALRAGLEQPRFVEDLEALGERDLELDVNGRPEMLPDVVRLAGRLPKLRVVINHAANVTVDGWAAPPDWRAGMAAAARHERVFCKVSALVEGTRRPGAAPASAEFYRPVLDVLWDCFGADRLIYGSNWPVCERFAPYRVVLGIVREYFGAQGREAAEKFFARNARAAYKHVDP